MFIIVYQNSSGPVNMLYATETTIDAAFGVCLLVLWATVLILAKICPPLMSEESIGQNKMFSIFSILSLGAALYSYAFIKETKGLTDRAKKEIFMPKSERVKIIE